MSEKIVTKLKHGGYMKKAVWLSLILVSAVFAQEAVAGGAAKLAPGGATFFTWLGIASIVSMAIAAIGVAFAQSAAAQKALDGAARQPEVAGKLMTQMLIALVFMETLAIYALLVVFLMLFVNPFTKYFLM
jgi:F-type H+-transporting ATPase subunit c